MTVKELKEYIDSLADDIEFWYNGVFGSICPISREEIDLTYGGVTETFASIDALMSAPVLGGKTLNEVAGKLDFGGMPNRFDNRSSI